MHRGTTARRSRTSSLSLEPLEPRLLLTSLFGAGTDTPVSQTITDADGDLLEITFRAPSGARVDILDTTGSGTFSGAPEDDIGAIRFTGTDVYSQFSILDTLAGGDDDIEILGGPANPGITSAPGAGMGLISLGVDADGDEAGETSFGPGIGVRIGGPLGAFLTSGDLDGDQGGFSLSAGGPIGFVLCQTLVLNSVTGLAEIEAGPGGSADISILMPIGGVETATGGGALPANVVTPAAPLLVRDDAGDGTAGTLRVAVGGRGATATIWTVPVPGGGSVVTRGIFDGALTVVGGGAGGDLPWLSAVPDGLPDSLLVAGNRDIDVATVDAADGLLSVRNLSPGGDIFSVVSHGPVGQVLTRPGGNVGALYTSASNSHPLFPQSWFYSESGVQASSLDLLQGGGIVNARILVGNNAGIIHTGNGGLVNSSVAVGGNLLRLGGGYAAGARVVVGGAGQLLQFGPDGVHDSTFNFLGGLRQSIVLGDMVRSHLYSVFNDGDQPATGGAIGSFRAANMVDSGVHAFGGFGTVMVPGHVIGSAIQGAFRDNFNGALVGGGANVISTGEVIDSTIVLRSHLNLLATGSWKDESQLALDGNLGTGVIRGDVMESALAVVGNLTGSLVVNGDVLDDGSGITVGGNSNRILVAGDVALGNGISIGGNSAFLLVRGSVNESGCDIAIGGNSGYLALAALDWAEITIGGDSATLLVGTVADDAAITIAGNSRLFRAGELCEVVVSIDGDAGMFLSAHISKAEITIGGDADYVRVKEIYRSEMMIQGDSGTFIAGMVDSSTVDIGFDSNVFVVGGLVDSYAYIDGASHLFRAGYLYYTDIEIGEQADRVLLGTVTYATDLDVGGNCTMLVIDRAVMLGSIVIGGNAPRIIVGGPGGAVDGDGSTLQIGGDAGLIQFRAGLAEMEIEVGGAVTQGITFAGPCAAVDITVAGGLPLLTAGPWEDGNVAAGGGFGRCLFQGAVVGGSFTSQAFDGLGQPIGGGMAFFRAACLTGSAFTLQNDLGSLSVGGPVTDSTFDLRAFTAQPNGFVGGGGIGRFTSGGLVNTTVDTFGPIDLMMLGAGGVDRMSSVHTWDADTGHVGMFATKGLVFGHLLFADGVGTLATGGATPVAPVAPFRSPLDSTADALLFVDRDGLPTGGTLAFAGVMHNPY